MSEEIIKKAFAYSKDPVYFIEDTLHLTLTEYDKDEILKMHSGPVILNSKPEITIPYLVWYMVFNPDFTILIGSPKFSEALELTELTKKYFYILPKWLKPNIKEQNKTSIGFEDSSRFFSSVIHCNFGKGLSVSKVYINSFEQVTKNTQKAVYRWWEIFPYQ